MAGSAYRTSAGMTVSDLADSLGTTVRALRHYEDARLLTPARDARQTRLYGPVDRARAEMIVLLRRADIPLKCIEAAMTGASGFDIEHVAQLLEERLASARAQIFEIERLLPAVRSGDFRDYRRLERVGDRNP